MRVQGVRVKNVRGTTPSRVEEGFHYQFEYCTDVHVSDGEAFSDNGGFTSSGFSAKETNSLHYQNCIARGMSVANGFTHTNCRQVTYANCRSYLNKIAEFNAGTSESVFYNNCIAGGRNVASATHCGANATLGGATYGFVVAFSSMNVRLSNCAGRGETIGVYVDNTCSYVSMGGDFTQCTTPYSFQAPRAATVEVGPVSVGTWVPDLQFGGAKVGITCSVQAGIYTRVGNLVYVDAHIVLTSKGTSVDAAALAALPFTCGALPGLSVVSYCTIATAALWFRVGAGASVLVFQGWTNATFADNTELYVSAMYRL